MFYLWSRRTIGPWYSNVPGKALAKTRGVTLLSYVIILSLVMSHMMNWLSLMLHTESTHASAMSKFGRYETGLFLCWCRGYTQITEGILHRPLSDRQMSEAFLKYIGRFIGNWRKDSGGSLLSWWKLNTFRHTCHDTITHFREICLLAVAYVTYGHVALLSAACLWLFTCFSHTLQHRQ